MRTCQTCFREYKRGGKLYCPQCSKASRLVRDDDTIRDAAVDEEDENDADNARSNAIRILEDSPDGQPSD